jgi:ABC-2 type transport system ATP-binding protein
MLWAILSLPSRSWPGPEPRIWPKLTPLEYLESLPVCGASIPDFPERAGAGGAPVSRGLEPHLQRAPVRLSGRRSSGRWRRWRARGHKTRADKPGEPPLEGHAALTARHVKGLLQDRVRSGGTVIMTTRILEVANAWPTASATSCPEG